MERMSNMPRRPGPTGEQFSVKQADPVSVADVEEGKKDTQILNPEQKTTVLGYLKNAKSRVEALKYHSRFKSDKRKDEVTEGLTTLEKKVEIDENTTRREIRATLVGIKSKYKDNASGSGRETLEVLEKVQKDIDRTQDMFFGEVDPAKIPENNMDTFVEGTKLQDQVLAQIDELIKNAKDDDLKKELGELKTQYKNLMAKSTTKGRIIALKNQLVENIKEGLKEKIVEKGKEVEDLLTGGLIDTAKKAAKKTGFTQTLTNREKGEKKGNLKNKLETKQEISNEDIQAARQVVRSEATFQDSANTALFKGESGLNKVVNTVMKATSRADRYVKRATSDDIKQVCKEQKEYCETKKDEGVNNIEALKRALLMIAVDGPVESQEGKSAKEVVQNRIKELDTEISKSPTPERLRALNTVKARLETTLSNMEKNNKQAYEAIEQQIAHDTKDVNDKTIELVTHDLILAEKDDESASKLYNSLLKEDVLEVASSAFESAIEVTEVALQTSPIPGASVAVLGIELAKESVQIAILLKEAKVAEDQVSENFKKAQTIIKTATDKRRVLNDEEKKQILKLEEDIAEKHNTFLEKSLNAAGKTAVMLPKAIGNTLATAVGVPAGLSNLADSVVANGVSNLLTAINANDLTLVADVVGNYEGELEDKLEASTEDLMSQSGLLDV